MRPDGGELDSDVQREAQPGKPVLHRPEGAASDLEPDEHEIEQVKGGLSPMKHE